MLDRRVRSREFLDRAAPMIGIPGAGVALSTQHDKRRLLKHHGFQPRWVPCDFERDDVTTSLRNAGFDSAKAALVVWLGVTYYLTTPRTESTLAQLKKLCTPDTRLIMDYGDPDIVGHDSLRPDVRRVSRYVSRKGEPHRTGMTVTQVDELLAQHGFRTITHQRAPTLLDRYDPTNSRRLARGDWNTVVTAYRVR